MVRNPQRSPRNHSHVADVVCDVMTDSPKAVSHNNHWTDREGIIELTHNYGTENDPNYKPHNGNKQPQGFGHVCISVDNIQVRTAPSNMLVVSQKQLF